MYTHLHLWQTSGGSALLSLLLLFLFFCTENQMSLSFYPCNAVHPMDLQGFLILSPGSDSFCFCATDLVLWVSEMRRSWEANYLDSRKSKGCYLKPCFSSGVMLALCPSPALLTEWCVCVKLCGRATSLGNSKEGLLLWRILFQMA